MTGGSPKVFTTRLASLPPGTTSSAGRLGSSLIVPRSRDCTSSSWDSSSASCLRSASGATDSGVVPARFACAYARASALRRCRSASISVIRARRSWSSRWMSSRTRLTSAGSSRFASAVATASRSFRINSMSSMLLRTLRPGGRGGTLRCYRRARRPPAPAGRPRRTPPRRRRCVRADICAGTWPVPGLCWCLGRAWPVLSWMARALVLALGSRPPACPACPACPAWSWCACRCRPAFRRAARTPQSPSFRPCWPLIAGLRGRRKQSPARSRQMPPLNPAVTHSDNRVSTWRISL